jgi:hypothetical protein
MIARAFKEWWECPHCQRRHSSGDFPDHWRDGADVFTFQCDCFAEFEVDVIWEPTFSADKRTLVIKEDNQ